MQTGSSFHVSLYARGGQEVDRDRPVDRRGSVGRSCLILHWINEIPKKNTFQSIFHKVHKNYILIGWSRIFFGFSCDGWPLQRANTGSTADASILFPIIAWQSWFRRNGHYLLRITKAMVRCICTCDTQLRHFVLETLLPTGRSRVSKKFYSRSQSKTSWPPLI